jgi:dTDP-4-dehydrorhamnose reductase
MRILLLGGTGMLGSDCKKIFSRDHEVIAPDKKDLDIISWDGVIESMDEVSPDVVVNCVGLTDMDVCETDDFAVRKINVEGPRNLAQGSARFQCKLVHISCDHVFDGQKMIPQPYFEDDTPNPLSAYGKSKVESETAVRENSPNYIIVRSGWVYGLNGNNFVKSLLSRGKRKRPKSIRVANDQFGSPTWTYRLALQIRELISHDGRGTYHATAEGSCSRSYCAEFILKKLDLKASVKPCSIKDLESSVIEPANCLLENRLLKKQGINIMLNWKEDMDAFLDEYGEALIKEVKGQGK